jgi:adenylate cyclase
MSSPSKKKPPGGRQIAALRRGLNDLAGLIGEDGKIAAGSAPQFVKRIPDLEDVLDKLEEKLRTQEYERDELDALYSVSKVIGSSLDLPEVLNQVMDRITGLTGAERAFLMLVDPDDGSLEVRAARNVDRETISSSEFEISRSIVKQVAATGEPVVTTNAQMDPRFKAQESVIGYNLRSILCVPLRALGKLTGVIYADNRAHTGLFTDRDRDLLAAFAGQAGIAIENARLFAGVASAKELMDGVFDSMASGVITTDIEGRITLLNRAVERILAVQASSATGASFGQALPALEADMAPLLDWVRTRGEPVVGMEIEASLPGRGPINLRASLSPLKDADEKTQGIAIVVDDLTEQRRLETVSHMFHRYVPPAVIERLLDDPSALNLGGQRQQITSLFADLRGFTNFSRQHDPETLVDVLNRYLAIGAEAISDEEGTLDKFMGDAVVAFFNAPLAQGDHVVRALRAALKIQIRTARLHGSLPPEYRLAFGVGINVGEAVVGNVGTVKQMDYTAIGTSVNLARRLQESAAPGQILISQAAYDQGGELIKTRELPVLQLDGFTEPVPVHELLGLRGHSS